MRTPNQQRYIDSQKRSRWVKPREAREASQGADGRLLFGEIKS